MSLDLDPRFSAGLRDALVEEVRRGGRPRRRRRWVSIIAPVIALGLAGGGVAIAVQEPWASIPGGDIVTPTSEYVSTEGAGDGTLVLGEPPAGSTAVEIRLSCLSAGRFRFPGGIGFMTCSPAEATDPRRTPQQIPLPPDRLLQVGAPDGARWRLEARYLDVEQTAWGVNDRGETYGGFHHERGMPDLVATGYVSDDGRVGYLRDAEAQGPMPTSPAHAIRIMREQERNPPVHNLYDTDGVTVIGCWQRDGAWHPPPCD